MIVICIWPQWVQELRAVGVAWPEKLSVVLLLGDAASQGLTLLGPSLSQAGALHSCALLWHFCSG